MNSANYQNPTPEEGINYSDEHPLKEFAQLLLGVGAFIAIVILLINLLAGAIALRIPFEYEKRMVGESEFVQVTPSKQQEYLANLAYRVASQMDLPPQMTLTVHYSDDPMVNAFATLGGNIIFFEGLLNAVESEDELAAVVAHEIAHIKHRHPIVALGKGLTVAVLAAFATGASGSSAGQWLIGSSANLTMLKYSREHELEADLEAAQALYALYGHIGGAQQLFATFAKLEGSEEGDSTAVEMFRSHPYSANRWLELENAAIAKGWKRTGKLTPIQSFDE